MLFSNQSLSAKTFSIKTTSQIVAMNSHTIRAWERRYKALDPSRNESNNRREYTPADIERLQILSKLVKAGHVIGHIASLSTDQLRSIMGPIDPVHSAKKTLLYENIINRCWIEVIARNFLQLHSEINSARNNLSTQDLIIEMIFPLLEMIQNAKLSQEINSAKAAITYNLIQAMLFEMSLDIQTSSHICRQPASGSRNDKIICLIPNFTDYSVVRMHGLAVFLSSQGYVPYVIDSKIDANALVEFIHAINTNFIILDSPDLENASIQYQDFLRNFLKMIPSKCAVWQFAHEDLAYKNQVNHRHLDSKNKIATIDFHNASQLIEDHITKLLRISAKPLNHLKH